MEEMGFEDWGSSITAVVQQYQRHQVLTTAIDYLSGISPAQWCQIFYLLSAGCVLLVASTPAEARSLLVNYGARKASAMSTSTSASTSASPSPLISSQDNDSSASSSQAGQKEETPPTPRKEIPNSNNNSDNKNNNNKTGNIFISLIEWLTSWGQIPHSWFSAFYVVSATCSLFWATQYFYLVVNNGYDDDDVDGSGGISTLPLRTIASWQEKHTKSSSSSSLSSTTTQDQIQLFIAWGMMFLQGTRRIYEHMTFLKPSSPSTNNSNKNSNNKKSTIWIVHWVLGLGFYIVTNIAVWVEGSGTILTTTQAATATSTPPPYTPQPPSTTIKLLISIPTFLYAWTNQYKCHNHLSKLIKYSLPDPQKAPLFKYFISPHYTCECLLYLSMALAAAPQDEYINKTLLCALIFVVVNLGVTARGTRQWYAAKFGDKAVEGKWNMIPFVF